MIGYVLTDWDDIVLLGFRLATITYAIAGMCYFGRRAMRTPRYRLVARSLLTFGTVMYVALFLIESQVLWTDGSLFVHNWFRSLYIASLAFPGVVGLVVLKFAELTVTDMFCRAKTQADRVSRITVGADK